VSDERDLKDATLDARSQLVEISAWIDDYNKDRTALEQMLMRAIKVGEETGEMVSEIIGWTGQNPRKGITSDKQHVLKEAYDGVLTLLGFAEHLNGNDGSSLAGLFAHIDRVHSRMLLSTTPVDQVPSDVKIDKTLDAL
jgi:hypothetical protein